MLNRGNKTIILKLKNQKMAKFVSICDVKGTLQNQTLIKPVRFKNLTGLFMQATRSGS
jgi:hypothetical protein